MSSQRFCLRWNNHQINLLSVFDQLLHDETFTDVTLAVEGQYLKAHKMVLSACSPYFQAIFVNHPEKHPIVILKDVPFKDMKCLLDFMYRGEVSVDQDRLAAFLRVAESLRIKGLTEVSDDKPPPPPTATLTSGPGSNQNQPQQQQQQQQQQNQQLQQQLAAAASRNTQLAALQQTQQLLQQKQKSTQSMLLTNPVLGSALSQQKRKRGRPRKLSGSDTGDGEYDGYESDSLVHTSPELLEVKMGVDGMSNSGDENIISRSVENDPDDSMDTTPNSPPIVNNNNNNINKIARSSPTLSGATATASATVCSTNNTTTTTTTSTSNNSTSNVKSSASSLKNENSMSDLANKPEITIIPHLPRTRSVPAASPPHVNSTMEVDGDVEDAEDEDEEDDSESELEFILPKCESTEDCSIVEVDPPSEQASNDEQDHPQQQQDQQSQQSHQVKPNTKQQQLFLHQLQQQHLQNLQLQRRSLAKMRMIHGPSQENGDSNAGIAIGSDPEDHDLGSPNTPMSSLGRTPSQDSYDEPNGNNSHFAPTRQPSRRRTRRKNLSPDDQAEALTEMSVRGLDLFRYARISDGVYQCKECAKENVQKTFKNKYSFQRHAFLYHEGAQRKVFPCPVCNKEFSRPDKMKNHLKTTHESYMPKSDPVYPMSFIVGTEQGPPSHATTKIETVLSAIQLQQHLNLQKELHNQQAKFQLQQQLISPKLVENGTQAIAVVAHTSSQ